VISAPKDPVPVFPLPGMVLFPYVMLPLHIFELRYRTMVREALSGERSIAMALLKPGWECDYHGSPEFFRLGCLARIDEVEWLPNDCYNLKVAGLTRVRFERVVQEFPYRSARVRVLQQDPYLEDDPLVQIEKRALLDSFQRLREAQAHGAPSKAAPFNDEMPYEALVNALCVGVDGAPEQKLDLLSLDSVIERGRRIREITEEHLKRHVPPPPPTEGGEQN